MPQYHAVPRGMILEKFLGLLIRISGRYSSPLKWIGCIPCDVSMQYHKPRLRVNHFLRDVLSHQNTKYTSWLKLIGHSHSESVSTQHSGTNRINWRNLLQKFVKSLQCIFINQIFFKTLIELDLIFPETLDSMDCSLMSKTKATMITMPDKWQRRSTVQLGAIVTTYLLRRYATQRKKQNTRRSINDQQNEPQVILKHFISNCIWFLPTWYKLITVALKAVTVGLEKKKKKSLKEETAINIAYLCCSSFIAGVK